MIINKHVLLIFLMLAGWYYKGHAQNVQYVTEQNISSLSGNLNLNSSYYFTESITITATTGKSVTISSAGGNKFISHLPTNPPPSPNENYVRVEVPKVPITSETDLTTLSADDKTVTYTYSDGLGRPLMTSVAEAGPYYEDLVQYMYYDPSSGQSSKSYLPYAKKYDLAGSYQSDAKTQTTGFYASPPDDIAQDSNPITSIDFEASPLNREETVQGPGDAWQTDNKKRSMSYFINEHLNDQDDLPHWIVSGGIPTRSGDYSTGQLRINEVVDEQDQKIQVAEDAMGNEVISRAWNGSQWITTVNVYDIFGRLRFVIPSAVSNNTSLTTAQIDGFVYQYEYDKFGNVIREKIPGAGWKEYVYDKWNRLVLSQNGVEKQAGYWIFSKYDADNRVIMKGRLNSSKTRTQLTADALLESRFETISNSVIGYTDNTTFPKTYAELYSITYYDSYHFADNTGWDTDLPSGSFDYQAASGLTMPLAVVVPVSAEGLVTGSKTKILGNSNFWLNTVVYYDEKYRVIQTISENHLSGKDRISTQVAFNGRVEKVLAEHEGSENLDLLTTYSYDHQHRLTEVSHQIDNQPEVVLASYSYNALGDLVEKNLHSTNNGSIYLQSVDYRYNIRGWLSSINNSSLADDGGTTNDDTNDLFGLEINYTNSLTINGQATAKRYDGNISSMIWKGNTIKDGTLDRTVQSFSYDQINRLDNSRYATDNSGNWIGNVDNYKTSYTYDDNGNISGLIRNAQEGEIDNLDYDYESSSNKLIRVEDSATGDKAAQGFQNKMVSSVPATEYHYDKNGNITFDGNKDIVALEYNELELIDRIEFYDGTEITYTYDAAGVKLSKQVKDGSNTILGKVDYVGTIEYLDNEINQVFTEEGRIYKQNSTYFYEYFIKDHQENNRLSFGILPERNIYVATMESEKSVSEESEFDFASLTRNTAENHTPLGNESIALNGTIANQKVGPAKVLTIQSGDVVTLEVFAKYTYGSWNNSSVTDIATVVGSVFGGTSAGSGAEGASSSLQNALGNPGPSGLFEDNSSGEPEAYMQYVFFDDSYNFVSTYSGFVAVGSESDGAFAKLSSELIINQSGYLFVYLANESNQNADVFFDDLKIIHESTEASLKVSQINNYYPFGLPMDNSWKHPGYIDPARLYQSSFATLDSLTQYYEFALRMYDPIIGRWLSTDPYQQYMSPYLGMGNSPINSIDPDGGFDWIRAKSGLVIWDANVNSQSDLDPESGATYLGKQGWSINEVSGEYVHHLNDGTTVNIPRILNEVIVTPNPITTAMYQGQEDFVNHPVVQGAFTLATSVIPIGGALKLARGLNKISRPLLKAANKSFAAKGAAYSVENIAGFYVRGSSTIAKGTYTRTIQSLASLSEGTSVPKLLRTFEAQARAGGANKVVLNGIDIVETRLINAQAAQRLGYTFKQTSSNSIRLTKILK